MTKLENMAEDKLENMEDVFRRIGGLGRFQMIVLVMMLFLEIPAAFLAFSPIVIGIPPKEWICDNITIPTSEACACEGERLPINPEESIISEWGLICEYAWVPDAIISLQLISTVMGSMVVSVLSDWYGRRYCYFVASLLMMTGTVLTALSTGPYMYAVARFFCGISLSGFMTLSIVYIMEFMTPEHRLLASSLGPLGEGVMILALVSYYIRPWRIIVWISVLPYIMTILTFIVIPESPRWLLRNQKITDCHKVLSKIAKINGRPPVEIKFLEAIAEKERAASGGAPSKASDEEETGEFTAKRFSYFDFYRQASLRKTTLILQVMWFSWGVVYFGITYNVKNLGLNLYLSLALMGLADAFGYPMALLLPKRHGRLKLMVFFLGMSAIFLGAVAALRLFPEFSGYDIALGVLAFLGKFGLSAARTPFRTLTGESYPTAVRTMGIGFARSLASVGAALAPQLVFIGTSWPALPYFVFAAIGSLNCCASLALTETSGKAMTEEVKINSIKRKNPDDHVQITDILPGN